MERSTTSWLRTLGIQLSLCFALYIVLNLGQPQKLVYNDNGSPFDLYFISVRGGFRSLQEQTHLLKLMGYVAKAYDLKFVVNISELGEDDPLMQNVTRLSPLLNVPWYTTGGSKHDGFGCFLHQVKLPHGRMWLLVCQIQRLNSLFTESMIRFLGFKPYRLAIWLLPWSEALHDTAVVESPSGKRGNLSNWLTRTLKATTSDWRMVVGFHPLVACKENEEEFTAKLINEPLHHIFVKFGVNVYLSQQGCCSYALQDNVAYIGNPGLIKENSRLGSGNGRYRIGTEMTNGFLLHRLGSLEMCMPEETYRFFELQNHPLILVLGIGCLNLFFLPATFHHSLSGDLLCYLSRGDRQKNCSSTKGQTGHLVPTLKPLAKIVFLAATGLVPLPVLKRGESESHHFQPLLPIFFLCLVHGQNLIHFAQ
ncbi:hypothetical protein GOBAR_AA30253 [Gossypium barbadense]|uniref:Calcineurin-like phosphoesterase domain-containing protein n=1 Tax=Gossypium barbadense TaxID=3634 RepID=A0A2P5WH60_GOSBA|nr:hypothetical protein GOBAR_AA30253 [Gossypium barbadense]